MADDNAAFPAPSEKQVLDARKEGIIEAVKESAKDAYQSGADQEYGGDAPTQRFAGQNDVAHIQDLVDLGEDELQDVLDGKHQRGPVTDARAAGLLEVERSGKNRTNIVKMLCKHLKIKSPYEVTSAGPAYTNDTTNLTEIK